MLRANILAHRGLWELPLEANSLESIDRALKGGFGIETDIRDLDGKLVISHDPPSAGDAFDLKTLLELYRKSKASSRVALNIKSDGLCPLIQQKLGKEVEL